MSFLFFFPSINPTTCSGSMLVQVITSELPLVMRETKARIYSAEAYFISKSLAEVLSLSLDKVFFKGIVVIVEISHQNFRCRSISRSH
ncbi:hypothetical protein ANCDUO_07430 [Ancylostoma duodenale]|uniref:Uncharacterized protein n=1 Tax=Ancylostoma duodenale TaxID=51022 RepID=A0A0C2DII3_9BILA|nr:hypothetical protein ANCDUO_07430 [Ancylostoma duodenale]